MTDLFKLFGKGSTKHKNQSDTANSSTGENTASSTHECRGLHSNKYNPDGNPIILGVRVTDCGGTEER